MYATKRNHNNVINATFYFYMSDHIYIASPLCKFLIELKEIRRVCKSWLEFQKLFKVAILFNSFLYLIPEAMYNGEKRMLPQMFAFYESLGSRIKLPLGALRQSDFQFYVSTKLHLLSSWVIQSIMKRLKILTLSFLSLALRPCDPYPCTLLYPVSLLIGGWDQCKEPMVNTKII